MTPWRPRRSSFSDVHCHRPDNKQNGAKGENPAQPAEAIGTPYLRHVPYRQPIPFGCYLTIASCATGQLPVPSKMGGWLSLSRLPRSSPVRGMPPDPPDRGRAFCALPRSKAHARIEFRPGSGLRENLPPSHGRTPRNVARACRDTISRCPAAWNCHVPSA
jgi:hypothetical protein